MLQRCLLCLGVLVSVSDGGLFFGGDKKGGGSQHTSTVDAQLQSSFVSHGFFRPKAGFADSAGEQAACVLDKALHVIQFSLCAPGTRLRAFKKGIRGDCDKSFLPNTAASLKQCCTGMEHLPSWASSSRCKLAIAPAVLRLDDLASAMSECLKKIAAHGATHDRWALGKSKDPGCARIYRELGAPLQSSTYSSIYVAAKSLYGYAHGRPEGVRKFLQECAPHKDDTYECNAITQAIWDRLEEAKKKELAREEKRNKKWARADRLMEQSSRCPAGYTFSKWHRGAEDFPCAAHGPQPNTRRCIVPRKQAASICKALGAKCKAIDMPLDVSWASKFRGMVALRGGDQVRDQHHAFNTCRKGKEPVLHSCPGMTCAENQKGVLCHTGSKFYRCCGGLWRDGKADCLVD